MALDIQAQDIIIDETAGLQNLQNSPLQPTSEMMLIRPLRRTAPTPRCNIS